MTLTFLKSIVHNHPAPLFNRLFLVLDLFHVSLWLGTGFTFLDGKLHKWFCVLSISHLEAHDILLPLIGDVNFDHLLTMFSCFSTVWLIFCPLQILSNWWVLAIAFTRSGINCMELFAWIPNNRNGVIQIWIVANVHNDYLRSLSICYPGFPGQRRKCKALSREG